MGPLCVNCDRETENIGLFRVPIWHCYSCDPMERATDILEEEDDVVDLSHGWDYYRSFKP